MTDRGLLRRIDGALLTVAATLGTLPVALLASAALARYLPLSDDARFAVGFAAVIPLWVTAMCVTLLIQTGRRALLGCLGVSLLLALLVFPFG